MAEVDVAVPIPLPCSPIVIGSKKLPTAGISVIEYLFQVLVSVSTVLLLLALEMYTCSPPIAPFIKMLYVHGVDLNQVGVAAGGCTIRA